MNSLPPHWLELELLARKKESSRLNDRSGEEVLKGCECLRQAVGNRRQSVSELASKASKESEAQLLESSDISEITEKVGTLEVGQEQLDRCTGAAKADADGMRKSSLLDLYYGASPTEREQKLVNRNDFDYVLEVYDFSPALRTDDLLSELKPNCPIPFRLKWVNDTHALVIFPSSTEASSVAKVPFAKLKVKVIGTGNHPESVAMAEKVAEKMRANLEVPLSRPVEKQRPKTTACVARRMVSHALGVRIQVSPKQKEKEENELNEAKAQKRKRSLKDQQLSPTARHY